MLLGCSGGCVRPFSVEFGSARAAQRKRRDMRFDCAGVVETHVGPPARGPQIAENRAGVDAHFHFWCSWAFLGCSWSLLVCFWAALGRSWGVIGDFGMLLVCSWGRVGALGHFLVRSGVRLRALTHFRACLWGALGAIWQSLAKHNALNVAGNPFLH